MDLVAGGLIGGLVGVIAAVNFVIYAGIEPGYEASLVEVFQQSPIAGVVTVIILLAGPVLGVLTARRSRRLDGPTEPGITQVVRLAAALDLCSIEELFGPAGSVRLVGEALEDSPEGKQKPGLSR